TVTTKFGSIPVTIITSLPAVTTTSLCPRRVRYSASLTRVGIPMPRTPLRRRPRAPIRLRLTLSRTRCTFRAILVPRPFAAAQPAASPYSQPRTMTPDNTLTDRQEGTTQGRDVNALESNFEIQACCVPIG